MRLETLRNRARGRWIAGRAIDECRASFQSGDQTVGAVEQRLDVLRFWKARDHHFGVAHRVGGSECVTHATTGFGREGGGAISGTIPNGEWQAGGRNSGGHGATDGAEAKEGSLHGGNIRLWADTVKCECHPERSEGPGPSGIDSPGPHIPCRFAPRDDRILFDMLTHVRIDGMTCQHCVRAVFTALAGVEGIARADVRIGSADVEHDGTVTAEQLDAALDVAGYSVARPKRTGGRYRRSRFA